MGMVKETILIVSRQHPENYPCSIFTVQDSKGTDKKRKINNDMRVKTKVKGKRIDYK